MDKLEIVTTKSRAHLNRWLQYQVDFVIVGIGILPNTELAESANLEINNGIFVNDKCQTSIANIYAAGDCTSFMHKSNLIRLESVGNAIDQAAIVAQNIMKKIRAIFQTLVLVRSIRVKVTNRWIKHWL